MNRSIFSKFSVEFDKRRITISKSIILTTIGSSLTKILIDILKVVYNIKIS